jgi:Fe-S-cluster-containing dehydrogenase component
MDGNCDIFIVIIHCNTIGCIPVCPVADAFRSAQGLIRSVFFMIVYVPDEHL